MWDMSSAVLFDFASLTQRVMSSGLVVCRSYVSHSALKKWYLSQQILALLSCEPGIILSLEIQF